MRSVILFCVYALGFSLALSCNDKNTTAPWQQISPPDNDDVPSNYVFSAFLLLEDCGVENSSVEFGLAGTNLSLQQFTENSVKYCYASPLNMCCHFAVLDSNGTLVAGGMTKRSGCEGFPGYAPDGSHLPAGYVADDTLFLRDYLLESWPQGRPAADHVIYTRIKEDGAVSRYAFPMLCGRYLLIDEDGQSTEQHYLAVGGCADFQAIKNRPEDFTPENFVDHAFLLLDDCILPGEREGKGTKFVVIDRNWYGNIIWYAFPFYLCGHYSVIDSIGALVLHNFPLRVGCEGSPDYVDASSYSLDGFVSGDTLYLQDYLLEDWPLGRPEWEHSIYTRVTTVGDTSRYAIPKLCGQYVLIDENGQPTGKYYVGVGGCAEYQALINQ